MFDLWKFTQTFQKCQLPFGPVGELPAFHTVFVRTGRSRLPYFAGTTVHVCGWSANVLNCSPELRHFGYPLCFTNKRLLAPRGDNPSLMMRDGTERTAAKAAAVGYQGELNWLKSGNWFLIRGMLSAGKREFIEMIQFIGGQRPHGRVCYDHGFRMRLY